LQLQADTRTTATMLSVAGLHVLDKKLKQNKKNVKNVTKIKQT